MKNIIGYVADCSMYCKECSRHGNIAIAQPVYCYEECLDSDWTCDSCGSIIKECTVAERPPSMIGEDPSLPDIVQDSKGKYGFTTRDGIKYSGYSSKEQADNCLVSYLIYQAMGGR